MSSSDFATSGCEKVCTSRHDLIWVNFPHIAPYSCYGACRLIRQVQRHRVIIAERSWPERAEVKELRIWFAVPRLQDMKIAGIDQSLNIFQPEPSRCRAFEHLEIISS